MRAGYVRGKPITGRHVTGEFDGFTSVDKTVCAAVTELALSLPTGSSRSSRVVRARRKRYAPAASKGKAGFSAGWGHLTGFL